MRVNIGVRNLHRHVTPDNRSTGKCIGGVVNDPFIVINGIVPRRINLCRIEVDGAHPAADT